MSARAHTQTKLQLTVGPLTIYSVFAKDSNLKIIKSLKCTIRTLQTAEGSTKFFLLLGNKSITITEIYTHVATSSFNTIKKVLDCEKYIRISEILHQAIRCYPRIHRPKAGSSYIGKRDQTSNMRQL